MGPLRIQVLVLGALLALPCLFASATWAQSADEQQLTSAQNQATLAQQQINEASSVASAAQRKLVAISPKAGQAASQATDALNRVRTLETDLAAQRTSALEEVNRLESDYKDDKQAHDDAVSTGAGLAIGSLILALVVLFWRRFRALPIVGRLSEGSWLKALGITLGGGLILLIVGGALLAGPTALRVGGGILITLALGLAVCLLVARHSLRVERREESSLLSRELFPRWVTVVAAILFLLIAVAGLSDAVSSDAPSKPVISAQTRALAAAAADDPLDPPTQALLAARQVAQPLVARSGRLGDKQQKAQAALAQARQSLRSARRRLRQAQSTVSNVSRRIAREAAREAARQAAAAPPAPSSGGGSTGSSAPSYTSCATAPSNIAVPPGSSLDRDGDGIGCES
jgi:type II secretory pathway pseudopilin PulG